MPLNPNFHIRHNYQPMNFENEVFRGIVLEIEGLTHNKAMTSKMRPHVGEYIPRVARRNKDTIAL